MRFEIGDRVVDVPPTVDIYGDPIPPRIPWHGIVKRILDIGAGIAPVYYVKPDGRRHLEARMSHEIQKER